MIFKPLNLFLKKYDLNFDGLLVDKEPFFIHQYFCQGQNEEEKNKKLIKLFEKYDLNKLGFNAGFFSFNTHLINYNTLENLFKLEKEIQDVNNHVNPTGSDQPIFNLYFNNVLYVENKDVCFCGVLDENTTAAHFCGGDKPWNRNEFSNHFGKLYIEKYKENLENFYVCINKL